MHDTRFCHLTHTPIYIYTCYLYTQNNNRFIYGFVRTKIPLDTFSITFNGFCWFCVDNLLFYRYCCLSRFSECGREQSEKTLKKKTPSPKRKHPTMRFSCMITIIIIIFVRMTLWITVTCCYHYYYVDLVKIREKRFAGTATTGHVLFLHSQQYPVM